MKHSARRVSVIAKGAMREKGAGFFVYPGVPALFRTAHSFLGEPAGFVSGYFHFALKIFL